MSGIALAIEQRRWEAVALYLLAGVVAAAAKLPPDSLTGLIELLGEGGHGGTRTS